MKTLQILITAIATTTLVACNSGAPSNANPTDGANNTTVALATNDIQVIQFHSQHRCMTCNAIEGHTKTTLGSMDAAIPFSLVNVDDVANEQLAEDFEASGTALYLYNPKTGAKKDLTDFAFLNARDSVAFQTQLAAAIVAFKMQ